MCTSFRGEKVAQGLKTSVPEPGLAAWLVSELSPSGVNSHSDLVHSRNLPRGLLPKSDCNGAVEGEN